MPRTKTKAQKALAGRAARSVPVCFEVYRGRRLIGWVDVNTYARSPKGEWTGHGDFTLRGRCVSLRAGVAKLLALSDEARAASAHKTRRPSRRGGKS